MTYKIAVSLLIMLTLGCKQDKLALETAMFITPPIEHHVISSPIEGRLLNNGEAMVNTKVIRKMEWNGDKEGSKEDVIYTDKTGWFSFPVFELDMAMRGLEQFVATTEIFFENDSGELTSFWLSPKQSQLLYSELGSKPEDLVCDLSYAEIATQQNHIAKNKVLTICRWKNMPEHHKI